MALFPSWSKCNIRDFLCCFNVVPSGAFGARTKRAACEFAAPSSSELDSVSHSASSTCSPSMESTSAVSLTSSFSCCTIASSSAGPETPSQDPSDKEMISSFASSSCWFSAGWKYPDLERSGMNSWFLMLSNMASKTLSGPDRESLEYVKTDFIRLECPPRISRSGTLAPYFAGNDNIVALQEWLEILTFWESFACFPRIMLIQLPNSAVPSGLTVAQPTMSGAGIKGKPASKGAARSCLSSHHAWTQLPSTTPTAGATASIKPPIQLLASLVLKSLMRISRKRGSPIAGSRETKSVCCMSIHLDLEYTAHNAAPHTILPHLSQPGSLRTWCNNTSCSTVKGAACFPVPVPLPWAAPMQRLDRRLWHKPPRPKTNSVNLMASIKDLSLLCGAPASLSWQKNAYSTFSSPGARTPDCRRYSKYLSMEFALFIKVEGALPARTSRNILNCCAMARSDFSWSIASHILGKSANTSNHRLRATSILASWSSFQLKGSLPETRSIQWSGPAETRAFFAGAT